MAASTTFALAGSLSAPPCRPVALLDRAALPLPLRQAAGHLRRSAARRAPRRSSCRPTIATGSRLAVRASAATTAEAPAPPTAIFRKDYTPTPYTIENVHLKFELGEEGTTVTSTMELAPNSASGAGGALELVGEEMELVGACLNGEALPEGAYSADAGSFVLASPPGGAFTLELTTRIHPETNTKLEGLYKSSGNFCTQCEAEGFRRITYFYDRPDVLACFRTTIVGDAAKYPVLLSNGNLVEEGKLENGQHFAVWEDPFPKPSYLFALVAGDLAAISDSFTTASGRDVTLRIYCQEHNIDKCDYAMDALKRSMRWDEEVYGLEYDLDLFNIVAVDDFNMGAMENKSLNVFNSRLVLATPDTATDADYSGIERVVAHEYFHNWTGNRVTCRDWFQLSLKEGLTVFRDQEFSADMNSRGVKRISDVAGLRAGQFPQDAGPMAHPVRPDSYIKMDNFYTVTVYNKGAEVVRMYHTLLGASGFRKGMDLYFERHDGGAVTCDDFLAAMADANDIDLTQFERWYSQAGTPRVDISTAYDADAQTLQLTCKQSCPATPGQPEKQPFLIPIKLGLIGSESKAELALNSAGDTETVLSLTEAEQTFTFEGIPERPVPSLLRGFSAPVVLSSDLSPADQLLLVAADTDDFNRWEALQNLARSLMLRLLDDAAEGKPLEMDEQLVGAVRAALADPRADAAFKCAVLSMPGEGEISEMVSPADPAAIHTVREFVVSSLAGALEAELIADFEATMPTPGEAYSPDPASRARRSLHNTCQAMLAKLKTPEAVARCVASYESATNMTDSFAALSALASVPGPEREALMASFYDKWEGDALVVNKWLGLQAASNVEGNLANVKALLDHPAFDIRNPNKVYALLGGFCSSPVNFHAADGSGYTFLADLVLQLDALNAQVASRMVSVFTRWSKYEPVRAAAMREQLERIAAADKLSPNTYEIVSKSLE
eukprot:jgi/Tetstr1/466190/TSEL_010749.t1